jgi:hypothetical protein
MNKNQFVNIKIDQINYEALLESSNYNLIYNILHNIYIYKPDEIFGKALDICKQNFPDADYKNLLNTILIKDKLESLKIMDAKSITYDKNLILSYAKAFNAGKCEEYLLNNLN